MIKDGLLAVSAGMIMPSIFARAVRAAQNAAQEGSKWALEAQNRILIVVQMAGGNDGLNTVVPYTDANYYHYRPTIGIKPSDLGFTFNDRLGAHPGLVAFEPLWQQNQLAIVEGVGYDNPSLSHFQAMDIWQTLDLSGQGSTGWLGKYVAGLVDRDGHPFQSLAVGSQLPTALRALNADVPVVSNPAQYRLQPDPAASNKGGAAGGALPDDPRLQALLKLYNTYPASAPYAALLDATAASATQGAKQLSQAVSQYRPSANAHYPNSGLGNGLKVLAEVVTQGLGLRVGYVTIGGFDTHAAQDNKAGNAQANAQAAGTHTKLLVDLSQSISAFLTDLNDHGVADNVVVMTWSEFGRRVHENASLGTDHGTAAPLFVLGNAVQGGIYGEPPDLGNLDSAGNLKYTVDFRSVYATVLDRWLGAPAAGVLGGTFGDQSFLPPT
jgi:uncharacterized protein (DUF1501 family)